MITKHYGLVKAMAIRHRSGPDLDPTTNLQILSGYRRLSAAIVKNAVKDLKCDDPYQAQEAADWLRIDGIKWLAMLGISDPGVGLDKLLRKFNFGRVVIKIRRQ